MQVPTHILSGWCVANCFELTPRERLLAMLAAAGSDIDGLSILFGESSFQTYHHLVTHGLWFAIVIGIGFGMMSAGTFARRARVGLLYVALVHLHLVMDYFGSGPYWPIYYLWPFDRTFRFINKTGWPLYSWQNGVVAAALLIWTIWIAKRLGRTPVESITPRLDREWVAYIRRTTARWKL